MDAELQGVEVERCAALAIRAGDDDFAVEDAALGQLCQKRGAQFWEIAVERLAVAALDEQVVAVAKENGAKAVPFGLELEGVAGWDRVDALGEHGQQRRWKGEVHVPSDSIPARR